MFPAKRCIPELLARRNVLLNPSLLTRVLGPINSYSFEPRRGKKQGGGNKLTELTSLFKPVPVKPNPDDINVGAELTGELDKNDLLIVLYKFAKTKQVQVLASQYGLDDQLLRQATNSFKRYCLNMSTLPVDLHVVLSDILQGAGHVTDIFPYFMRHAKVMFPHIECIDDLKKISDLRTPANWYPLARSTTRKIIFHAGPTNSGKTYHALERFMKSKSGVYCGPLKLLATEVFQKCNNLQTPCDLVTGEERMYAKDAEHKSAHVACTVEMTKINEPYEVAVIDEIQMLKDSSRGWAWTRALLGLVADEIHLCGEPGAVDVVKALCMTTGEDVEVRRYKRLTELQVESRGVGSLENIQPGDCIVCFSKNDIYTITRDLEARGTEVAVIYGGLPPNTKLAQAAKFNDPDHPCKVLVSTDAIGMGLNLHIRRVIFYSLIKPTVNEKGEKEMDTISVSSALQIAGRAGRYGTQWEQGYVTTFKHSDLPILASLLSQTPEPVTQAGLHPTADQIELYAYHLPNSTMANLMDIFVSLCVVDDSMYFMCNLDDFKFLAEMIQHVPLPLRARYVFCCAPINKKMPFICTMFLKFARQYSKNEEITFSWLCQQIGWPVAPPKNLLDLLHLEAVFDVLDLYLWFSYRFTDLFPHKDLVRDMQRELDVVIQAGIGQLTKLLNNAETGVSSGASSAPDDAFEMNTKKQAYWRGPSTKRDAQPFKGRKLAERLLSQGLITPNMLRELQREWSEGLKQQEEEPDDPDLNDQSRKSPKSRKPK